MEKNKNLKNTTNFSELLNAKYGKVGTKNRDEFDERAQAFVLSEIKAVYLKRS